MKINPERRLHIADPDTIYLYVAFYHTSEFPMKCDTAKDTLLTSQVLESWFFFFLILLLLLVLKLTFSIKKETLTKKHWYKEMFDIRPFLFLKVKMKFLSYVWLFAIPLTVAYQAPPCMVFSRQAYWIGLPFPSTGYLPHPGIETGLSTLQADSFPAESHL